MAFGIYWLHLVNKKKKHTQTFIYTAIKIENWNKIEWNRSTLAT